MNSDQARIADDLLAVLLTTGDDATRVSVASVRAVLETLGLGSRSITRMTSSHGAELDGDSLRPTEFHVYAPEVHLELVIAIRSGADALDAVLGDIVRHALRASGDLSPLLDPVLDAARAADPFLAYDTLVTELDAAASSDKVSDEVFALIERRIAMLALDIGRDEATDRLIAVQATATNAHNERRSMAYAYHASRIAPAELAEHLLDVVAASSEQLAPGWAARARSLQSLAAGDIEGCAAEARVAVHEAVRHADPDLESHALVALAHARAWNGDLRGAIMLQQRALRIARTAGGWRAAAVGAGNLAWMLIEDLRLAEAQMVNAELIELINDHGLHAHLAEALLHGARIAHLGGDLAAARAMMARHGSLPGLDDETSYDDVYRANRVAELSIAIELPDAGDRVATALNLSDSHGTIDQELDVCLIEAQLDDVAARTRAYERIPDVIDGAEPYTAAQALTMLARRVVVDVDELAVDALNAAIAATEPGRCALLDLAIDEAVASQSSSQMQLEIVAGHWREHGFLLDAALCEASAGVVAATVHSGDADRLLTSAHRALSDMGCAHQTMRVRAARERARGPMVVTRAERSFLDEVSADEARELHALTIRQIVPLGHVFPTDRICSIVSGIARVEAIDESGTSSSTLDLVGPGWTTNLAAVVDQDLTQRTTIVAHTPCVVDTIAVSSLIAQAGQSVPFALSLARALATQSERLSRVLHRRTDPILDRRVAATILMCSDELGTPEPGGIVRLRLQRTVIADLVGATRETISRVIAQLMSEGTLERSGHSFLVIDRAALERAARG